MTLNENNKKALERKLETVSSLWRNNEITDKAFDVVDTALRLQLGWITIDEVWETFVTPIK